MKRLNPVPVLIFICSVVLLSAAAPDPATGGNATPLDRDMDQVVIAGREFENAKGRKISGLRLVAFSESGPLAIPFQIDERLPGGDYAMKRMDGKVDRDADGGLFDDNDELVFMAKDAGARGDPGSCGLSPSAWEEIELRDPASGDKAWAYLLAFDEDPPALSPVRYMQYIQKEDHDQVVSPHYTLHFPKNDVFISDLMIHESAGGSGRDFMDKIKMRSGVDMLGGAFTVSRTEEDFVHEVKGYIEGPVRVIRQTSTRLVILLSLKSPSAVVNGSFYPCCFQFPSMLSLPFRLDLIASDVFLRQGWDMNRNALGFECVSNLNSEPVAFDGSMSDQELKLAASPETLYWFLCSGQAGTFMFFGVWNQKAPIRALLYYEDDLTHMEPPENEPGVMGFAYKLVDLLKVGGDEYPFNIVNYVVPNYDRDLERALRVYEHPIEIKVSP